METTNKNELLSSYCIADSIINKKYLDIMDKLEITKVPISVENSNLDIILTLYKINKLSYTKNEDIYQKLTTVYSATCSLKSSLVVIIDSIGKETDFYIGVKSFEKRDIAHCSSEILNNTLKGNFPGIEIEKKENPNEFMNDIMSNSSSIVAVSGVGDNRNKEKTNNKNFIQGIEKFIDAMHGKKYTAIFIADPVSSVQIDDIKKGYEDMYTTMIPFWKSTLSYGESDSQAVSESISNGITETISKSVAKTQSHTEALTHGDSSGINLGLNLGTNTSKNKSSSTGTTVNPNANKALAIQTASSVLSKVLSEVGPVVLLAIPGGAPFAPLVPLVSGAISGAGNVLAGINNNKGTNNYSSSIGESIGFNVGGSFGYHKEKIDSKTVSNTDSKTNTNTKSNAISQQETKGQTQTNTKSRTKQLNFEDKKISNLIDKIQIQLRRIKECENFGMYNCGAYFVSSNPSVALNAASTYKSIIIGDESAVEKSAITIWRKENGSNERLDSVKKYIKKLCHPLISMPIIENENKVDFINYTTASLISGAELPLHIGFPNKSIIGLPVVEHIEFGKNIKYNTNEKLKLVNIGNLYNMGEEVGYPIELELQSFASHIFVSGSTGSGKSNAIYNMLEAIKKNNIKFMVIEPAKGEYKNVFGYENNVKVFGTNPIYTELLKINPFKFDKKIHVLEHIDRLIEIFNVCWPMYAAMPAILKDAILQSYEECGWDLVNSENNSNVFPSFQDVLEQLVKVIDSSAYDKEVKSNYKGSLETRIKSLTNGLNGQIFSKNEIQDNILFDSNVIIDLSRVGSLETKSLIMGILIMRLNEYRMSNFTCMNEQLKHVTVIEEAHNILKRTSNNGGEGADVISKSVEMLSNSIAEMRTYGEGFIIVDQSPNAVDISAIRNTNTKIIMRLPEENDRRIAGKSAGLKDEQLDEIAKLPRGVAVIYQNNWIEPVLCKIKKFQGNIKVYNYINNKKIKKINDDDFNKSKLHLIKLLIKDKVNEKIDFNMEEIKKLLSSEIISNKNIMKIDKIVNEYQKTKKLILWEDNKFPELSLLVTEILGVEKQVYNNVILYSHDIEILNESMNKIIKSKLSNLSKEMEMIIAQCFIRNLVEKNMEFTQIYFSWQEFLKGKIR
jgi:DNA helicase HerA-like ATPase